MADSGFPPNELETARPQTMGEEELQLQLALAMSKEEAENEEAKRKSDDVRLQIALNKSEQEYKSVWIVQIRDNFTGIVQYDFTPAE